MIATRILIDRRFPEAQTTDARAAELRLRPGAIEQATDAVTAARERERDAGARTYITTFSDWLVTRSVTRSTLAAEFPDGALAAQWEGYSNNVTSYVRLASIRDVPTRRELVDQLSIYLESDSFGLDWTPLAQPPSRVRPHTQAYQRANATLAERLLDRKKDLVAGVLQAHAAGYSTRPSDLVRDLFPFVG